MSERCDPDTCKKLSSLDQFLGASSDAYTVKDWQALYKILTDFLASNQFTDAMAPTWCYEKINVLPKAIRSKFTKNPDRHNGAKHTHDTLAIMSIVAMFAIETMRAVIPARNKETADAKIAREESFKQIEIFEHPEEHVIDRTELSNGRDEECFGIRYAYIKEIGKFAKMQCPLKIVKDSEYCACCIAANKESKRAEKIAELKKLKELTRKLEAELSEFAK